MGLAQQTTIETVTDFLRGQGFEVETNNINLFNTDNSKGMTATVKIEDPSFAENLSKRLKEQNSTLSAIPLPTDSRQRHTRKIHISWHKATRVVWINFGSGDLANRVARRFNDGTYKCVGQVVKSTTGKESESRSRWNRQSSNPAAWTIKLSHVPSDANRQDIERAVFMRCDKPSHIEVGSLSYYASDAEVSVEVRSKLEEYGPLENFYFPAVALGKRVKATACFQDEADANAACSLNHRSMKILGTGKLTVTQMQSLKIKVATRVYLASKTRIEEAAKAWRQQHIGFYIYQDPRDSQS